jgi:hypothetical protein
MSANPFALNFDRERPQLEETFAFGLVSDNIPTLGTPFISAAGGDI